MAPDAITRLKERVNLRIVVTALGVGVLGIFLMYASAQESLWKENETWRIVLQNMGSLLFVTVAITLIWELWGKRAFLDEILAKVQISKDMASAGIISISKDFQTGIDWESHFHSVRELDIFFAYGRTWRNAHISKLREVASRKDTEIRVLLPDPEDEKTTHELARRFNYSDDKVRDLIREAEEYFENLRPSKSSSGAKIEIWFLPATPVFSFYRFDDIAVLALLSHRRQLVEVPSFVCEKGGTLYNFIRQEFDFMISQARPAREVGA